MVQQLLFALFALFAAEVALVFLFLSDSPLRKPAVLALDVLKCGGCPVTGEMLAVTVAVVLWSIISGVNDIWALAEQEGGLAPAGQVLLSRRHLEAPLTSLIAYTVLLGLIIDRLHHNIRELCRLRESKKSSDADRAREGFTFTGKNNQHTSFPNVAKNPWGVDGVTAKEKEIARLNEQIKALKSDSEKRLKEVNDLWSSDGIKAKDGEIASLNEQIKTLRTQSEERLNELKVAEASAQALKKQAEGIRLEYDRLLEDNQSLWSQLKSINHKFSHSAYKKTV